jgi:transposase-like protein
VFTNEYKRAVVAEYTAAPKGAKGAVLRREGLYDSHVLEWRAAIEAGTLETGYRRGRRKGTTARSPEAARIVELERENVRLHALIEAKDVAIADREAALDVLGKGVAFLELLSSRNAR